MKGEKMVENKLNILVVDDDRRMVRTICDILKINGYEASDAYSGEEAAEKVSAVTFDCVLMDIKMPGAGGINALQLIKGHAPDLPVILMSAYATEDVAIEAKKQGAYAVLAKPFDVQMVLSFLSLLRREESILIVDDDPLFCKTLTDILQSRGCRVQSEHDPGKVLDHMKEEYKLVVVLDIKLGDTKGLDVLKAIRKKYPTKPVLLVTGYRDEMTDSIKKGLQIGAYTCLYKPLPDEALINAIKEIRRKKLCAVLGEAFENAPVAQGINACASEMSSRAVRGKNGQA
jgi:two-component system response regulator HydG